MAGLEDELLDRAKQLNNVRDRTWGGAAMAAAPTLNAVREGPPGAGQEVASRFFEKPKAKLDPMDSLGLKKDIIDSMAKVEKERLAGKMSVKDAYAENTKLAEKLIDASVGAFGSQNAAWAGTVSSTKAAMVSGLNNMADNTMKMFAGTNAGNADAVARAYEELRPLFQGATIGDEAPIALRQKLQELPVSDRPLLLATLDMDTGVEENGGMQQILQKSATAQGTASQDAGQVLNMWQASQQQVADITDKASKLPFAMLGAMYSNLGGGSMVGSDQIRKNLETLAETAKNLGLMKDPAAQAAELDKMLEALKPDAGAGKDSIDQYNKLLGDMDKPDEQLSPVLKEARRQFMNDPKFKAWMEAEGLTDPNVALRELRRRLRLRTQERRAADKQTLADKAAGVPKPDTSPASAALTDKGTPSKEAPPDASKLEPGMVLGPTGPMMFSGTELVPLTPEERAQLKADLEASPEYMTSFKATKDRFAEYEKAVRAAAAPKAPVPARIAPTMPTPEAPKPNTFVDVAASANEKLTGMMSEAKKKRDEEKRKKLGQAGVAPQTTEQML